MKFVPASAPIRTCASSKCAMRAARRSASSTHGSLRSRDEARRRLDGRRDLAPAQGRAHPDPGGVPELQLAAGRRQAGALYARRSAHAFPRVRTRVAPPAHAGRGSRRLGHQRRGVGRGRAAEPVHGELLLGVGRAAGDDPARRYRSAFTKTIIRENAGREEFPERACDAAPDRVRGVRHAVHSDFDPASGRSALDLLQEVRKQVAVLFPPAYNRPNSFGHIFGGG